VGTCVASDKLGFDRPGALARYFAERWLEEPSTQGEQIIAWLLEAALGRNALYFIERTKEYVDKWGGSGEIVPENAFNGFVITGDPIEDTIIPHAVLVWTCMNDRLWGEEVYHRWLDSLLAAGSAEAAYLAASLWPAHDLMTKVTYRPVQWLVYRGRLDAEAERLILTEMLKGEYGPRTSLYGPFAYDAVQYPEILPEQYIRRHGFTHPICGLVEPIELEWGSDLKNCIQEALAAPSWSEGVKGAAMLLYLSLKAFKELKANSQDILNTLEKNLFKLDEIHNNIINFHMDKIEEIDYNLLKYYINYLIILYNRVTNESNLPMKMFSKYMSIGLRTKDIFYIGKDFRDIIFNLMLKEKEKVGSWLENQIDDLRIKNLLLATYMTKNIDYITIDEELKTEQVEKKIEDIYGKIKYIDKIKLFIDQVRIYFYEYHDSCIICNFIENILKREGRISFIRNFIVDLEIIINSLHPKRNVILKQDMFLDSNHIGLYLYYSILNNWDHKLVDFRDHIKRQKEIKIYSNIKDKIIENFYIHIMDNIGAKLNFYFKKIESNNLPYEEIKYELINELIDIIENNYDKILEYFKDENELKTARKVILYNVELFRNNLRNLGLIELFGINIKPQNTIIY